jgi:hypothetical protein
MMLRVSPPVKNKKLVKVVVITNSLELYLHYNTRYAVISYNQPPPYTSGLSKHQKQENNNRVTVLLYKIRKMNKQKVSIILHVTTLQN